MKELVNDNTIDIKGFVSILNDVKSRKIKYTIEEGEDINLISEDEVRDILEGYACEFLITSRGQCNWENIRILKNNGFNVYAGEKDSFGWLTGVINCGVVSIIYG